MEARASIPTTLPRPNPTVSYWQDPPGAISDLRSTESLPETADVVIVGSGISGATVAWNLLARGGEHAAKKDAGSKLTNGTEPGTVHLNGLRGPIARRGGPVPSNSPRLAAGASSNTETGTVHLNGLTGPIARRGGTVPSNSARLAAGKSSNKTPRSGTDARNNENGDIGQSIVMLEARQTCSGATGRNGSLPSPQRDQI